MPSKASNRPLAALKRGRIEKHQGEPFQSLQSPPIPSPLLRCTIRRAPSVDALASVETFS